MIQEEKICYLCDPEKNVACPKTGCAYNPNAIQRVCYSTLEKEYARLDFAGQPVVNYDLSEEIRQKVKENFEEEGPIVMPAEQLYAEDLRIPNGGYKDPKWISLAEEIAKKTAERGLPWYTGLFNQQLIAEIYKEYEETEGETDR